MKETWKAIPGFNGAYEVSDLGRVKSLPKYHYSDERILSPSYSRYPKVCLSLKGKRYYRSVHSLVMLAFVGECPDELEILHADNNKLNARLSNLSYGTHAKNIQDAQRTGVKPIGSAMDNTSLTERDVLSMRQYYLDGLLHSDLSIKYGVSRAVVQSILTSKTWKHIACIHPDAYKEQMALNKRRQRKRTTITEELVALIKRLYSEGLSLGSIANRLDISKSCVAKYA